MKKKQNKFNTREIGRNDYVFSVSSLESIANAVGVWSTVHAGKLRCVQRA